MSSFDAVYLIIFGMLRVKKFFSDFSSVRSLVRSFFRSPARAKTFPEIVRVVAIELVRKSSKSEPSSRFFGRLKIFSKNFRNVTDGRFPCGIKSTASNYDPYVIGEKKNRVFRVSRLPVIVF